MNPTKPFPLTSLTLGVQLISPVTISRTPTLGRQLFDSYTDDLSGGSTEVISQFFAADTDTVRNGARCRRDVQSVFSVPEFNVTI